MPTTARDSLTAPLIAALDAQRGHTVLEIGAGPGDRTALLCDLLGAAAVVTIEPDPVVAKAVHTVCWRRGYNPRVIHGDGDGGYAQRAPYDRVITSKAVGRIPAVWIEQAKPGGLIVAPLGSGWWRLEVGDDGAASGQMITTTAPAQTQTAGLLPDAEAVALTQTGGDLVFAGHLARAYHRQDALTALAALALPDVQRVVVHGDHPCTIWVDPASRSWARLDANRLTTWGGPRELLPELELLYNWWALAGEPTPEHWGMTVAPDGVHALWVARHGQHQLALPALHR